MLRVIVFKEERVFDIDGTSRIESETVETFEGYYAASDAMHCRDELNEKHKNHNRWYKAETVI